MTRLGSLFSGYGGLDMGVQAVLGGSTAWVSDIDPGACKILAHRYPGVPNLGDITTVDWSSVEPVDVLTGGSPCQDLSHAGKRGGMTAGTRSNLWVAMREAIAQLRPSLVIWENVRGAYSAEADSELEPCSGCLGGARDGEPSLRALGRVLGDLSELGYMGGWHGLRAADVGAPHGRFRVFVVAYPASDAGRLEHGDGAAASDAHVTVGQARRGRPGTGDAGRLQPVVGGDALLPTPAAYDGQRGGPQHPDKRQAGGHSVTLQDAVHGLLPTPQARDWKGAGPADMKRHDPNLSAISELLPNSNGHGASLAIEAQRLLPTPSVADGAGGHLSRSGDRSSELLLPGVAKQITKESHADQAHTRRDSLLVEGQEDGDLLALDGSEGQPVRTREVHNGQGEELQGASMGMGAARGADTRGVDAGSSLPSAGVRESRTPGAGDLVGECAAGECGENRMSPGTSAVGTEYVPQPDGDQSVSDVSQRGQSEIQGATVEWGQYRLAIERWERILGRSAPPPTILSSRGTPQLSPRFSEFLMGLPDGWVTDVPGLTRNEALKAIGNGVCPQQCATALRFLLTVTEAAA